MKQELKKIDVDESMKPVVSFLATGRDEMLEKQLITKSRQDNIVKFTPKDGKERFADLESLEKWFAKGREIHWLLGPEDDLAGIIWYGKSDFPLDTKLDEVPTETFAIRIYDGYAGHGLARPFMTQSLKTFATERQEQDGKVPGIWLQTDIDNPAAVAAYTKFGYEEVARDDKRTTMVLPSKSIKAMV